MLPQFSSSGFMALLFLLVFDSYLVFAFYHLPPELIQSLIMQQSTSFQSLTLDLSLYLLNKSTLDFCFIAKQKHCQGA